MPCIPAEKPQTNWPEDGSPDGCLARRLMAKTERKRDERVVMLREINKSTKRANKDKNKRF
jgi:hypothetical protein